MPWFLLKRLMLGFEVNEKSKSQTSLSTMLPRGRLVEGDAPA
jgi:hypothetical protein